MAACVLKNQYVKIRNIPDRIWKVSCGSGMGLPCSGEISDASVYSLMEKSTITHANRHNYSIVYYGRFKDDILLIVGGTMDTRLELVRLIEERLCFFKIKVESVSSASVEFLDIRLIKGEGWKQCGILDFEVYRKTTSQWLPLSQTSMHNPFVHMCWPAALSKRNKMHCSSKRVARHVLCNFYDELCIGGNEGGASYAQVHTIPKRPQFFGSSDVSRLILPYDFVWEAARIPRVLAGVNSRWGSMQDHPVCYSVPLRWTLGGQHLVKVIKAFNNVVHKDATDKHKSIFMW